MIKGRIHSIETLGLLDGPGQMAAGNTPTASGSSIPPSSPAAAPAASQSGTRGMPTSMDQSGTQTAARTAADNDPTTDNDNNLAVNGN